MNIRLILESFMFWFYFIWVYQMDQLEEEEATLLAPRESNEEIMARAYAVQKQSKLYRSSAD